MPAVVWLAAVALLFTASPMARAAEQDIYSVMGIELDVRARTATLARERAIAQAEVKGFAALLYKLLDHDSPLIGKVHPAAQIRPMVRAFEIGEEKSASGRYIATYHVSYDPRSVRQYLGRLNVAFSEIPGDRLLVFPIWVETKQQVDKIPVGLIHLLDAHVVQLERIGHALKGRAVSAVVSHSQRQGDAQGRDEEILGGCLAVEFSIQLEGEIVVGLDQLQLGGAQRPR